MSGYCCLKFKAASHNEGFIVALLRIKTLTVAPMEAIGYDKI